MIKQIIISTLIILISNGRIIGQRLTTSNLPIVIIDTQQQDIPDEPKINATMGIIYNGPDQTNNINDSFNHYNGNIGIESRGNSTQDFDKKSYSIELWDVLGEDISLPLLGMAEEEDWILHSMVIDKSHVRIPMTFYFAQRMGHYASNWRYVEVVINGEYRGLYILTEKIKRDRNRVDISKLKEDDLSGDQLTGGYILRIDWLEDPEGFESQYNSQGGEPMFFQWYYPRARDIKPEQAEYIENWIGNFEDALFSSNYRNERGERYTDLIDIDSFVDFLLINELSKNSDGYKLSSYIHKDRDSKGGKLVAGPIWDFDQTYGVSEVCSNADFTGWTYLQNQEACEDLETMPMWWQRMMNDSHFQNRMRCRWEQFRGSFLHLDSINNWIDDDTQLIADAITRNFNKWDDFLGEHIWYEPEPLPETYEEEISYLKTWISNRLAWMDSNIQECGSEVVGASGREINNFKIYPNPSSGIFYVKSNNEITIEVIDLFGQSVLKNQGKLVDLSTFKKGAYIFRIQTGNTSVTRTVIKN